MSTTIWHAFPDKTLCNVCGLPWFNDNQPLLWRFPKDVVDRLPTGVANKVPFPSGGRLLMKSNTTALGLKVTAKTGSNGKGLDIYINGKFNKSVAVAEVDTEVEMIFYSEFKPEEREIAIYLPYHQEIEIHAIGVDAEATLQPLEPVFQTPLPIVFYGSSICQGSGAT
ncbi:MAG: SGNH/GDSL hydrolase N-terminal domain-containing protein, partial [Candidatus Latescibacteria bacterium]|nr:SGNH/GDSL hydrolase N-terminal domain-containing protein [Candidatus Latescibacterota bacterium]